MIKVAGSSNVTEIIQLLREKGTASIICGKCSKLLLENENKVAIEETVYCQNDAAAMMGREPTDEVFTGRLLPCRTKGLRNLYFYAPNPGSN